MIADTKSQKNDNPSETGGSMSLLRLLRAVEALRTIESDMPLQRVASLLVIATTPEGCTMRHIADETGVFLSTANRNVAALGDTHWRGKKGLGLVTTRPDPDESRRSLVELTPKGRRVMQSMLNALGE